MTKPTGIRERQRARKVARIERRVARVERGLGSLLLYLAALGIIGEEDFGILPRELEAAGIPLHPRRDEEE